MPKLFCSNFDLAKRDTDDGLAETTRFFGEGKRELKRERGGGVTETTGY